MFHVLVSHIAFSKWHVTKIPIKLPLSLDREGPPLSDFPGVHRMLHMQTLPAAGCSKPPANNQTHSQRNFCGKLGEKKQGCRLRTLHAPPPSFLGVYCQCRYASYGRAEQIRVNTASGGSLFPFFLFFFTFSLSLSVEHTPDSLSTSVGFRSPIRVRAVAQPGPGHSGCDAHLGIPQILVLGELGILRGGGLFVILCSSSKHRWGWLIFTRLRRGERQHGLCAKEGASALGI